MKLVTLLLAVNNGRYITAADDVLGLGKNCSSFHTSEDKCRMGKIELFCGLLFICPGCCYLGAIGGAFVVYLIMA